MPQQTIGSQIQTDLRRVQRQQDIEEYEDYRLLNKLMSSTPDSGVQESRDLTIEGKVWDKTKLGIDSQFDVIRNFVSDEKGNIRKDLTHEKINEAEKHLPNVIKSIKRIYNQPGSHQIDNYIDALGIRLGEGLESARRANIAEDQIGILTQQIKDLGDPFSKGYISPRHGEYMPLERGEYDISKGAEKILDNITTLSDNNRSIQGDKVNNPFSDLFDMLSNKQHVFEAYHYYSANPDGVDAIRSSPKARRVYEEVARLMRTGGDEDIALMKEYIDELPGLLGEQDINTFKDMGKLAKEEKELDDEQFDLQMRQLQQHVEAFKFGEDYTDDDFAEFANYVMGQQNVGAWSHPKIAKKGREITLNTLMTQLHGVDGFNKDTTLDEGWASDLDIMDEVRADNRAKVLEYFLDDMPVKGNEWTKRGVKTVGEARVYKIKSGKDGGVKHKSAIGKIQGMLDMLRLLEGRYPEEWSLDMNPSASDVSSFMEGSWFKSRYGEKE